MNVSTSMCHDCDSSLDKADAGIMRLNQINLASSSSPVIAESRLEPVGEDDIHVVFDRADVHGKSADPRIARAALVERHTHGDLCVVSSINGRAGKRERHGLSRPAVVGQSTQAWRIAEDVVLVRSRARRRAQQRIVGRDSRAAHDIAHRAGCPSCPTKWCWSESGSNPGWHSRPHRCSPSWRKR